MNVLDLFSGIGGFSLGLGRAGPFRPIAFCEIEPHPRAVLAKHWPDVPCYRDVRTLSADALRADGLPFPDLICGGFPCQDISAAGKGAGIDGARSSLWFDMARIIGECRPRWVVVENSPRLRRLGADRVLGDLEAHGYDCWPAVVGAVHAGAWHRRQRAWIIAADVDRVREHERAEGGHEAWDRLANGAPADAGGDGGAARCLQVWAGRHTPHPGDADAPYAADPGLEVLQPGRQAELASAIGACSWAAEPDVVRMAYGVPARVDRIAGLGNAVVPAVAAMIGRAIMAVERSL